MTTWHIFYTNSTKEISWVTNAEITNAIKTEQPNAGFSYLSKDRDELPSQSDFYVNSDGTDIVEKSVFNYSFDTTTPALEGVVTVTGLPAGTQVFVDGTSAGTMSDTSLTLTATEPGDYKILFSKSDYKKDSGKTIKVKRYGE